MGVNAGDKSIGTKNENKENDNFKKGSHNRAPFIGKIRAGTFRYFSRRQCCQRADNHLACSR
jgi:hypothetical protein